MNDWGKATRSVHAGGRADPATGARAPPIYQTTSYEFESADHAADLYALASEGDVYSRISNPTTRALEERLTALEGGAGAVVTSSGMAALDAATFLLATPGDTIVSSSAIYGGTTAYFNHVAGRRGIETRFVDPLDYTGYEEAIDEETAYAHIETVGNPSLVTPDLERVSEIAHENATPLFVDNTFATPALCRPLERGADLVWESTTKWLHGSGTTVGGVLVDGGSFDWTGYEELAGENSAYTGIDFSRDFPGAPFAAAARFRSLRALGAQQAPFDAWQTLQGLESFSLRMKRHCENAAIVAEFLSDHEGVAWVTYPGLESHETHENASEYLEGGFGGMIAFGLESGYDGGKRVCEAVDLVSFVANIGDAKSLIIHPASTTHGQLSAAQREASGVSDDLVRLSVGIEDPEDILADLDRAIELATESAE
jgi:O-acetylhomoserine (thiol)-lyase